MQVAGSPFAPHGPGDQIRPVDQSVTLYCQDAPNGEVPVDADQTGRVAMPRLKEPQHLENWNCIKQEECHAADDLTRWIGRIAKLRGDFGTGGRIRKVAERAVQQHRLTRQHATKGVVHRELTFNRQSITTSYVLTRRLINCLLDSEVSLRFFEAVNSSGLPVLLARRFTPAEIGGAWSNFCCPWSEVLG